jgi:hypothetical protein
MKPVVRPVCEHAAKTMLKMRESAVKALLKGIVDIGHPH